MRANLKEKDRVYCKTSRFLITYKLLAKDVHRKVTMQGAKVSKECATFQGEKHLHQEDKGELEGLSGTASNRNLKQEMMRKDRVMAIE